MRRLILCLILCFAALPSFAQSTIRDAETEDFLDRYAASIFTAAGLSPSNVRIVIIQDDSLNAFVAGGQTVFIHSGLIMHSTNPALVLGVIAHEVGHIIGGHVVQKRGEMKDAGLKIALGTVLGIASVAAGAPAESAAAIMQGSKHAAERGFLSHSRSHEEAADQAAIRLLKQSNIPLNGLIDLLKELERRQRQFVKDIDQYALTHPISQQRISHLESALADNPTKAMNQQTQQEWAQIVAKFRGFLRDSSDGSPFDSTSDEYALEEAIRHHRNADFAPALTTVRRLISAAPSNPYLYELYGQMQHEQGKLDAAISAYRKAINLEGNQALLHLLLANAFIAQEQPSSYEEALKSLSKALILEPDNVAAWRQKGVALGRLGQLSASYHAFAEASARMEKWEEAEGFIQQAEEHQDSADDNLKQRIANLKTFIEKNRD